jgi:lactoylglutathione lyase
MASPETLNAKLELIYNWDTEHYPDGRNFGHVAFEVDDISAELLQKGNPLPAREPWYSMPNQGTW